MLALAEPAVQQQIRYIWGNSQGPEAVPVDDHESLVSPSGMVAEPDRTLVSILSRQVLRYGDFRTANDLVRTIEAFIRRWNRDQAKPFRWTYQGRPLVSE